MSECFFGEEDLASIASNILKLRGNRNLIFFSGDLGAGKTTLCREILRLMGYKSSVKSPTFGMVQEYKIGHQLSIYHMDLYRAKNKSELLEAGIYEILYNSNLCLVEWPELLEEEFGKAALKIELLHSEGGRTMRIPE